MESLAVPPLGYTGISYCFGSWLPLPTGPLSFPQRLGAGWEGLLQDTEIPSRVVVAFGFSKSGCGVWYGIQMHIQPMKPAVYFSCK